MRVHDARISPASFCILGLQAQSSSSQHKFYKLKVSISWKVQTENRQQKLLWNGSPITSDGHMVSRTFPILKITSFLCLGFLFISCRLGICCNGSIYSKFHRFPLNFRKMSSIRICNDMLNWQSKYVFNRLKQIWSTQRSSCAKRL